MANCGLGIFESGRAELNNKFPIPNKVKYPQLEIWNTQLGILCPIWCFILLVLYKEVIVNRTFISETDQIQNWVFLRMSLFSFRLSIIWHLLYSYVSLSICMFVRSPPARTSGGGIVLACLAGRWRSCWSVISIITIRGMQIIQYWILR